MGRMALGAGVVVLDRAVCGLPPFYRFMNPVLALPGMV